MTDKMKTEWVLRQKVPISSPEDAYNLVKDRFPPDQETFIVCLLNAKNLAFRIILASMGTLTASLVHPREVFRSAIKYSAASIILAHNHPSGDPTPSREDIEITERLTDGGKLLGIDMLDHIVVGNGRFESLREAGYL